MTKIQKQIILASFLVLFSFLSWFFLHQFFYLGGGAFLILSVIGFLFWGASLCLTILLVNKKILLYLSFILSLILFFVFFRGGDIVSARSLEIFYYSIVLFLIFITFLFYKLRARREMKTRINLNFWRILRRGLPLIFTLLCLLVALAYYFSPSLGGISDAEFEIPRGIFDAALKPLGGLIKTRLPLYSPDMTVDELLTVFSLADSEGVSDLSFIPSIELYNLIQSKGISIETLDINKLLKDPEIVNALREDIRERTNSLSRTQLAQQRLVLSEKLGIEINAGETLNDVLYKLVNAQISGISGEYKEYLPIALAIALFFSLRLLAVILIPCIILFTWIMIKLLIKLNFIKIGTELARAERLEL